ncbi:MAG TPA: hypothetical protein IAA40_07135 [Candidatus Olsenella excrementigallinarum]|uniref:hypothetical protein n=1 Tax=Olsenella timonensis TaxID=1805478 RepID=UPI00094E6511|nr:hypothetical protein [Olsenella timonensis]HJB49156.1 hypothetical protein [Candidatus Olsenella excrementigallinarum]
MASGDWQRRLMEWLRGRQGPDDLAVFSVNLAIVIVLVNVFARTGWLGWVGLALVAYAMFRIQSRNLGARARENEAFLRALGPARPWVQNPRAAWAELRAYKHVRCSSCRQRVRVPRGKGRLRVTCPRCKTKFEVRS